MATLVFDADCGICVAAAGWAARRTPLDLHGNGTAAAALHLRDLPPAARGRCVHHVDALGRRTSGGAAVAAVLRDVPGWRWLGNALSAAPGVTERGYRVVARHRARISSSIGLRACRSAGPAEPD